MASSLKPTWVAINTISPVISKPEGGQQASNDRNRLRPNFSTSRYRRAIVDAATRLVDGLGPRPEHGKASSGLSPIDDRKAIIAAVRTGRHVSSKATTPCGACHVKTDQDSTPDQITVPIKSVSTDSLPDLRTSEKEDMLGIDHQSKESSDLREHSGAAPDAEPNYASALNSYSEAFDYNINPEIRSSRTTSKQSVAAFDVASALLESPCSTASELSSISLDGLDDLLSDLSKPAGEEPPVRPFLRRPTSPTLWDHKSSAIPLLTPSLRLPTCFRIAELLRLLGDRGGSIIFAIELYAVQKQILEAEEPGVEHVILADIFFPQHPPYILGMTNQPIRESQRLKKTRIVPAADLVRVILSPSQWTNFNSSGNVPLPPISGSQAGVKAQLRILSIRASHWDEVRYVRGIVDPQD